MHGHHKTQKRGLMIMLILGIIIGCVLIIIVTLQEKIEREAMRNTTQDISSFTDISSLEQDIEMNLRLDDLDLNLE
ncbi:MAG: hypothetical protein LRY41_03325 [Candidatus Pacebacteria bacterium]|nr:hypothetical protein [Candidatus Paceibacterota bacterium]MCD8508039.1 hypothetical protein [Candidatus Paceibacterota bacterium]MCD8528322.1 hypothetical protein [Candidatus Paceibacterota bacterium]MCD8563820.1 hypothetical protein [Candidatus Paceibacterota bacterium]